jgi:Tfp pilus assembly protein PilN
MESSRVKRNSPGRVSVAVGATEITASAPGAGRPHVIVRGTAGSDGARMSIAQVFAELDAWLRTTTGAGSEGTTVDVAIMPSLCDVRLVALPPMRAAEAESVIRREANKYFTVSTDVRVIGVLMPQQPRSAAGTAVPVMAASAPHALLDEINSAALQRDWVVRRIVPAHAAWLSAVTGVEGGRAGRTGSAGFIALEGDHLYVVRIENGSPIHARRLQRTDFAGVATALEGSGGGRVLLFADDRVREGTAPYLSSGGWTVAPAPMGGAAAAAQHAATAQLELVSAASHAMRAMRQRSLANRLAAAAVVLLLAAAGVAHWGARRELDVVRARRAALQGRVAPLVALRDSAERLEERMRETSALFESGAQWSKTLYEITMLLPPDAHLTRVNATGDTIVIEAEGARAGDALLALSRAPSLRDVRMDGPVQRELEAGSTATERFVIQGTLASAKPAAKTATRRVKASARPPAPTLDGRQP